MEVEAIERILGDYKFKDRLLLEEAFTHSSVDGQPSYQRLEFVGDAVLGLAVTKFVFLTNPTLDPGPLTLLRAANISTEKLARVAVRHGLYRFLRHNSATLDHSVEDFTAMVMKEAMEDAGRLQHGGSIKAPKVLADIVESFAAAVYIDCDYNLETFWKVFRGMLEPIITEETVEEQPVAALYMFCQKNGRRLGIKNQIEGSLNIVSILVDGQLVCTASSEQKLMARINAARTALRLLSASPVAELCSVTTGNEAAGKKDVECKQRLHSLCGKNHWGCPVYRIVEEDGPAHKKEYISSVQVEIDNNSVLVSFGDRKPRVKDSEKSAAMKLLSDLLIEGGEKRRRLLPAAMNHAVFHGFRPSGFFTGEMQKRDRYSTGSVMWQKMNRLLPVPPSTCPKTNIEKINNNH
ncbi:ribonuclease 3-like protein 2 [Zingiber officinale]|uniref:ribonuclease 3-like protein 2 n=1 Tax=Zingiber officinale TaxID=94328 RepID=UPI001C4D1561|nr:ribonuclease 3-like protein 2 [Zingiber officinale]